MAPHLLSQFLTKEFVLHQLHNWRATMGAIIISLCQDLSTPFIHCQYLMNDEPKKGRVFLYLAFVPNDPPIQRGGGRYLISSFVGDWVFGSLLSSNPLPPNVGQIFHEASNLKPPPPCRVNEMNKLSWD
jgi:hypothetical protein